MRFERLATDIDKAVRFMAACGYDFDALAKKGFAVAPAQYRRYEKAGFKTPTGKIEAPLDITSSSSDSVDIAVRGVGTWRRT